MPTEETQPSSFDHPGLQLVYKTLVELEARLPEEQGEGVRNALDVMSGWCRGEYSVPALLGRLARLERLARDVVARVRREHDEAVMRVGDGRANKEASLAAVLALYAALGPRAEDRPGMQALVVELPREWLPLLETLAAGPYEPVDVPGVLAELADHAQQGVYRPLAWERHWLVQAFGDDFTKRLVPDERPGRLNSDGRAVYDRPVGDDDA